jgi:CRISPR-associated DxTHG motif protein
VETLQAKLGHRVEWVDIPEGRSEQELWEIFDRVASAVDEGDTILLDITHAFRSIPMIVFADRCLPSADEGCDDCAHSSMGLMRRGTKITERPSLT